VAGDGRIDGVFEQILNLVADLFVHDDLPRIGMPEASARH
jgi:hypothetical protein